MRKRVLFVVDSASQLKPAHAVAHQFRIDRGWEVLGNLVPSSVNPSAAQVIESGVLTPFRTEPVANFAASGLFGAVDAIVAFLPGSSLHALLHHLEHWASWANPTKRPVTITGYNGVVYERHLEGLLWRTGYDFICVNSARDRRDFETHLQALRYEGSELVTTGLPLAQGAGRDVAAIAPPSSRDVLFAPQAVVPRTRAEREYLLRQLVAYAETFPERKVYIKPRTRPTERTFHVEKHHYARLASEMLGQDLPTNLLFAYGSLDRFLDRIGLVISVSSTAVLEARARGVPGAILTDLGIKESLGNHFFRDSGMLTTMPALLDDRWPVADSEWLQDNGFGEGDSLSALVERVSSFLDHQDTLGVRTATSPPYYDLERAPHVHLKSASETLPKQRARIAKKKTPPQPAQARRAQFRLESAYRKGRKLLRDPRAFFADARFWKRSSPR